MTHCLFLPTRLLRPGRGGANVARAEVLRAHCARKTDCKLHVVMQLTYDSDVMIYYR